MLPERTDDAGRETHGAATSVLHLSHEGPFVALWLTEALPGHSGSSRVDEVVRRGYSSLVMDLVASEGLLPVGSEIIFRVMRRGLSGCDH